MRHGWACWVAQGFGLGHLPVAPGTWGTLAGVGWTALLLATGSGWVFALGCVGGLAAAVACGGAAEQRLGRTDPPSVVLDELAAVPVCFAGWLVVHALHTGRLLTPAELVRDGAWLVTLAVVLAFRFFDVLKPWPVRQSQTLPGGWGITLDDLLAAFYVNAVVTPVLAFGRPATAPGHF